MHLWIFLLLIVLSFGQQILFERVQSPKGWTVAGVPAPDEAILFRIALRPPQQRLKLFEQTISVVSDPYHARYGQHLRGAQLKNLLRANESAKAVRDWLAASGIDEDDIQGDDEWINFSTTISGAEKLLNTTFQIYRNTIDQRQLVRTLQYSVPKGIAASIDLIHPTTRFPPIRPAHDDIIRATVLGDFAVAVNSSCAGSIVPTCLQELYNMREFDLSSNSSRTGFMGVSGYLKQYAHYADLTKFQQKFYPPATGANFTWTSINGGLLNQSSTGDSTEANLDIQYATSLTYPLPVNFYSTGGLGFLVPDNDQPIQADNTNEPYLEELTYLMNLPDGQLPHTLITSYGEDEQSIPASYAQKVCNMFGALGLRGVSVIFSSGDDGVGSACETNDGTNQTRFNPGFPASCPYVTAVGATMSVGPEVATPFSGGGFSERWPRPWWQQNAVVAYLGILGNEKWAGLYNTWGRGIPDVAAQGQNFLVINNGFTLGLSGTSCAAPTFASIIALINALKLQSGQSPLGFLNPWLYTHAYSALNDITQGGSVGCTGHDKFTGLPTPFVPYASWNATDGWDPVTGLGTPDFQKLLQLAMAPPPRRHRKIRR